MARMIDADALQELCNKRIKDTWNSKTAPVSWAEAYADFKDDINSIPAFAQPGNPLTLDQLREMDGQPVWVVCLKKEKYIDPPIGWRILEKSISGSFGVWNGENCLSQRSYSSDWFAYSYPPAQQRWIKEANTPPTNGDRIRTMDNKELSEWLYSIMVSECCDMTCPGREFCEPGHKGLLDWLQATYKEE